MPIELETKRMQEIAQLESELNDLTSVLNNLITRASKLEVRMRIAVENSEFFNGVKVEMTEDVKGGN